MVDEIQTLPAPQPLATQSALPPARQLVMGATVPNAKSYVEICVILDQIIMVVDRGYEYEVRMRDDQSVWLPPVSIAPVAIALGVRFARQDNQPEHDPHSDPGPPAGHHDWTDEPTSIDYRDEKPYARQMDE